LAADTGGNDGPTDAAGVLVDGGTARRIQDGGSDPAEALASNNAHAALRAGNALLVTGPTGTNVNDLRVALVGPDKNGANGLLIRRLASLMAARDAPIPLRGERTLFMTFRRARRDQKAVAIPTSYTKSESAGFVERRASEECPSGKK
jgi:hypothetical protein